MSRTIEFGHKKKLDLESSIRLQLKTSMWWRKSQKSYFDYFEELARLILTSAHELQHIYVSADFITESAAKIKSLEHSGDLVAHQAFNQMNTSGFILPLDREDIFLLIQTLDDVLDFIDDSSESFSEIYELNKTTPFAKKLSLGILEGAKLLAATCTLVRKPGWNRKKILKNCLEIHHIENEADVIKKEALQQLFRNLRSEEISYADYAAWSHIYQILEGVSDKIEDCADVAEQFVMKYT